MAALYWNCADKRARHDVMAGTYAPRQIQFALKLLF